MRLKALKVMAVLVMGLAMLASSALAGEVEVLHWWTSGGEAAAVGVLKQMLEKQGHTWKDFAVAGGAGANAMTALKSRAVAGNPPTAAQVKGPQIQKWAEMGVLANLDAVAKANKWDEIVPPQVARIMKYEGHWVAVPVNVHKINWMWVNPTVVKRSLCKIPTTWEEFFTVADKIKRSNFIPVAFGGQNWQEATAFESVVASVGGTEFYNKTMVKADPAALDSATMVKCFEVLRKIKSFTDKGAPGRDWNLATAMLIKDKAAFQFMGDWAKGEFTAAKKSPGTDYVAFPVPGTSGQYLFNVDSFIMFKQSDPAAQKAQEAMAAAILSPEFQVVFNVNKGSIPVAMGIPREKFDDIAHRAMSEFTACAADGNLVPSMAHEMAVDPAVREAMFDVITNFYNSDMKASEAAMKLSQAVKAAKQ